MKWDSVKIVLNRKEFDTKSMPYDTSLPVGAPVIAEIMEISQEQFDALKHQLPPSHQVPLTHALFSPSGIEHPRAWLLKWARENGLEMVYDNEFTNDDRWIVGFAGEFPRKWPEELQRITLTA